MQTHYKLIDKKLLNQTLWFWYL